MAKIEVNWDELAGELGGEVGAALRGLVAGAEEDLKEFGAAIAKDLVRAVRAGREDLQAELVDQARALAEIHRIHLVEAGWEEVTRVLAVVGRVVLKTLAVAAVSAI